jgi:hypothetical protein
VGRAACRSGGRARRSACSPSAAARRAAQPRLGGARDRARRARRDARRADEALRLPRHRRRARIGLAAALRWLAAGCRSSRSRGSSRARPRGRAEALAALLAYGVAAQLVPSDWLAWTAALGASRCGFALAERRGGWARCSASRCCGRWSRSPSGSPAARPRWRRPAAARRRAGWREVLLRLVPLAAASASSPGRNRDEPRLALARAAASVALRRAAQPVQARLRDRHVRAVRRLGLAERTVWQALLVGAGCSPLWRAPDRGSAPRRSRCSRSRWRTSPGSRCCCTTRCGARSTSARWPLANLLLAATRSPRGAGRARAPARRPLAWVGWAVDAALMALIALFALSQLRQAFSGSLLTAAPMTQTEDLLRSLLGIVLAIGFLAWGARSGTRSWRVGSLVLMLLAVGKVFLVDAAGSKGCCASPASWRSASA